MLLRYLMDENNQIDKLSSQWKKMVQSDQTQQLRKSLNDSCIKTLRDVRANKSSDAENCPHARRLIHFLDEYIENKEIRKNRIIAIISVIASVAAAIFAAISIFK